MLTSKSSPNMRSNSKTAIQISQPVALLSLSLPLVTPVIKRTFFSRICECACIWWYASQNRANCRNDNTCVCLWYALKIEMQCNAKRYICDENVQHKASDRFIFNIFFLEIYIIFVKCVKLRLENSDASLHRAFECLNKRSFWLWFCQITFYLPICLPFNTTQKKKIQIFPKACWPKHLEYWYVCDVSVWLFAFFPFEIVFGWRKNETKKTAY